MFKRNIIMLTPWQPLVVGKPALAHFHKSINPSSSPGTLVINFLRNRGASEGFLRITYTRDVIFRRYTGRGPAFERCVSQNPSDLVGLVPESAWKVLHFLLRFFWGVPVNPPCNLYSNIIQPKKTWTLESSNFFQGVSISTLPRIHVHITAVKMYGFV